MAIFRFRISFTVLQLYKIKFQFLSFLCTLILVSCSGLLFAQNENYIFEQLSLRDGLSQSNVNCIAQDKLGFIWIGTQDGLNKFDGYHFSIYRNNPKKNNSISNSYIHDIVVDTSGNIWLATDNGLNKFDPSTEQFLHYELHHRGSELKQKFSALYIYKNVLYATISNIGLCKINLYEKDAQLQLIDINMLLQNSILQSIIVDQNQTLWIGTNNQGLIAYNLHNNTSAQYLSNNTTGLKSNCIFSVFEFDDNTLWLGTDKGLAVFNKNKKQAETIQHNIYRQNGLSNNIINDIYKDHSGNIWLATFGGLNKYNSKTQKFSRLQYSAENKKGISSNKTNCVFEDNTGTIWIGTESGINKFNRQHNKFKLYSPRIHFNQKEITNNVWGIYVDETNNDIYIGNDVGFTVYNKESGDYFSLPVYSYNKLDATSVTCFERISEQTLLVGCEQGLYEYNVLSRKIKSFKIGSSQVDLLKDKFILCLKKDSKDNLWVGTKEGLIKISLFNRKTEYFINAKNNEMSISNNEIRTIFEDMDGTIWVGTFGGGINKVSYLSSTPGITDKIIFKRYFFKPNDENSISNNNILSIAQTEKGKLWLGTYGGGINKFDINTGKTDRLPIFSNMQGNTIYSILPENNNLWCSSNNGLLKFNLNDTTLISYYENDGLQSNEFNSGSAYKAQDGNLYFGGVEGFNEFNPSKIKLDTVAPRVVITALKIFNKPIDSFKDKPLHKSISYTQQIVLSYKQNFFSFEFAAMYFSSPQNNEFKYMMEGLDENWNYVGKQNQAFYTNLEPGHYVFKVIGSNSDGVWGSTPAMIDIIITPPFWKTWWFRIFMTLCVIATIYYYTKQKANRTLKQKRFLENIINERTATVIKQKDEIEKQKVLLEEQKKRTESLVLSILPKETAEELMNKGFSRPRNYSLCTVMFADFQGFTKVAEKLRPQQLIDELNKYFSAFDEIAVKYNLERIKTIGDSYMCAGGIPIRNKSNPIESVLAALEIQNYMKNAFIEIDGVRYDWKVRIGINSGEIIAGVIGKTKFAFDIWGDTVNTASRTETSGEAGKINITRATYDYVKDFFDVTKRGKIAAKNKGEIEMFFVDGIKPHLSLDGEGVIPNELFYKTLSQVLIEKFNYKKSETRIIKLLTDKLPEGLYYHGIHHTLDVTRAAEDIAREEGVDGEDLFLLKTAALFHDAGFVQEYTKNERIGVGYAREILPKYGYTEQQIDIIEGIIMATQMPQNPKTHLEMIMCDADLDYLGRDDFYEISDSLKRELIEFGKINNDKDWDLMQVPFLENHQYFTQTNKTRREPKKQQRLKEIKLKLQDDNNYKDS